MNGGRSSRRITWAALQVLQGFLLLCCGTGSDGKAAFSSGGASTADGADASGGAFSDTGGASASGAGGAKGQESQELGECETGGIAMPTAIVVSFVEAEQPSSGSGGVVRPGEYELSEWIQYRSPQPIVTQKGAALSGVMILSEDGTGKRVLNWDGEIERSSFEWETAAGYLGFTFLCPVIVKEEIEANFYSVTSNTITLLNDNKQALTFVRR